MTTEQQANPRADQSPDPTLAAASRRAAKRLIWFLGVLYFINYLDRINIWFAAPNGMNQELGLTPSMFGLASGLFFIGYLMLEVPSNIALHRFGARRWIARIMVSWGIVATIMTFVPNEQWMYALRFLLGVAEAGFFPGIILYLTFWFPKERAKAVALFMLAVPLSSAIGAPLSAWLISTGHGLFDLDGWRSCSWSRACRRSSSASSAGSTSPTGPRDAPWLADDERRGLVTRWTPRRRPRPPASTSRSGSRSPGRGSGRSRSSTSASCTGCTRWVSSCRRSSPASSRSHTDFYGMVEQGFIMAIPFVFGCFSMYFWARHGDRTGERVWHVAIPLIVGGIAIPITLYLSRPFAAMVAVTICTMGIWPCCRASGRCRRRSSPGRRRPAGSR